MGWAMTTNRPDVADAWQVKFEDPKNPLAYKYGDEWRQATEWSEVIKVKWANRLKIASTPSARRIMAPA